MPRMTRMLMTMIVSIVYHRPSTLAIIVVQEKLHRIFNLFLFFACLPYDYYWLRMLTMIKRIIRFSFFFFFSFVTRIFFSFNRIKYSSCQVFEISRFCNWLNSSLFHLVQQNQEQNFCLRVNHVVKSFDLQVNKLKVNVIWIYWNLMDGCQITSLNRKRQKRVNFVFAELHDYERFHTRLDNQWIVTHNDWSDGKTKASLFIHLFVF